MPHVTLLPLLLAAFAAGVVDAIGGGGGLLTVPALLAVGLPPHVVLATNKGQAVFGAVSSAVTYARQGGIDRERAPIAFACGALGSLGGASLLLAVRPEPLRPIVLALLVGAAILLIVPRPSAHGARSLRHPRVVLGGIALGLGAYDGFFGPGVGTLLIVAFMLAFGDGVTRASGNAKVVNLASNLAAFALFAIGGRIVWTLALPMATANAIGAALGARLALRRGDRFVRFVVLGVAVVMIAKLAFDLRRGG